MERITKRHYELIGTYEYIDAFSGAGIFNSFIKGLTSKFVKDTAKALGNKALVVGVNKIENKLELDNLIK